MDKKIIKSLMPLIIALGGILVTIAAALMLPNLPKKEGITVLTQEEISQKILKYINENLLQGQAPASITETSEENGLVKMKLKIGDNEFNSYATKDGKLFFPTVLNLEEQEQNSANNGEPNEKSCEEIKKLTASLLDAFVVSKCPFGVQMQRILAEVVKNIPQLAADIKVRYIGAVSGGKITSMHGDAEAQENLRQICIREETDKYWNYISCHIKEGDVDNCLNGAGIDKNKLNSCMTDSSKGLKYAQEDFDLQENYGVSGSPTLILNNEEVSEFWFGGRTAEALKTLLCCGFEEKPGVCSQSLSTENAATSFSTTYSQGNSAPNDGGCE